MCEHGFPQSRIIVIQQTEDYISPGGHRSARWLCKCTCGNPEFFVVKGLELRNGDTQSCGCIKVESHKKYNKFQLNLIDEYGMFGIGYCTNTNSKFYFDMGDYNRINDYCWYEVDNGAYRTMEAWDKNSGTQIKMHWLIAGKYYDHADRNPFNNRRYNLRQATSSQNSANRSMLKRNKYGFIGIYWEEKRNKWKAAIGVENKSINLGRFTNKDDAIRARLRAEKEYFGDFAPQKHLFSEYGIED